MYNRRSAGGKSPKKSSNTRRTGRTNYQLGGEPLDDWDAITKNANYPKIDIPEDRSDYVGILKAVHVAEQGAIGVYDDLMKFLQSSQTKDPVTTHLIRHIMGEEMHHEEEIETLLGL